MFYILGVSLQILVLINQFRLEKPLSVKSSRSEEAAALKGADSDVRAVLDMWVFDIQ